LFAAIAVMLMGLPRGEVSVEFRRWDGPYHLVLAVKNGTNRRVCVRDDPRVFYSDGFERNGRTTVLVSGEVARYPFEGFVPIEPHGSQEVRIGPLDHLSPSPAQYKPSALRVRVVPWTIFEETEASERTARYPKFIRDLLFRKYSATDSYWYSAAVTAARPSVTIAPEEPPGR
jgi:hypothetical protein